MGLAIARGLLKAIGGRVWAENCPAAARGFRSSFPGRRGRLKPRA
jgi:signal transduction histidine kinase